MAVENSVGDLISREALAEKFKKAKNYAQSDLLKIVLSDVVDAIEEAPAVDAVPVVHGRWEDKGYITTAYGSIDTGCCPACGAVDVPIEPYDYYYPNCGAKMDGDKDALD